MSTAQARRIRELEDEKARLHTLLTAVLATDGGSIRIPRSILAGTMLSEVSSVWDGDEFVVWLGGHDHQPRRPGRFSLRGH